MHSLLEGLNPWRLLAYASVLLFCLLACQRLDGAIACSWWLVFCPLFLWKLGVLVGCVMGCARYRRMGPTRWDQLIQFRAMLLSSLLLSLLLAFEFMACLRLQHDLLRWTLAVIPLLALSIVSIGAVVWSMRHDRSCDLELFCASNLLQFVFLALQLDGLITWSWGFVLIPLWIALCVAIILVMYSLVLACLLLRSSHQVGRSLARHSLHTAIGHAVAVVPLLAFCVLLTEKLDQRVQTAYLTVGCPLLLSLLAMCAMSFFTRRCNVWWFGIGQEFGQFLLESCPLLQEYANVSYKTVPPPQLWQQHQSQQLSSSAPPTVDDAPSSSNDPSGAAISVAASAYNNSGVLSASSPGGPLQPLATLLTDCGIAATAAGASSALQIVAPD